MKVDYEDFLGADDGFRALEVDVADVLDKAMADDPRRLMSLFITVASRNCLTLQTALSLSQKSDLRTVMEAICHE